MRLAPLLLAVLLTAAPAAADGPVLLDRIAARVDERVILRSDVLARARPALVREPGADAKAVYRETLERMIDEVLVQKDAARKHLTVTDDEVHRALDAVLSMNKIGRIVLDTELARLGITYDDYLSELRQQLLQAKWMQLAPRASELPRDPDKYARALDAQRKQMLDKLRQNAYVDVRE